jgi:hypothetical protein
MRSYVYIDNMQPQFAAYVGATVQGDVPVAGMAELWIEVAPANQAFRLMDVALKAADVRPATQFIEREFGLLEVHSYDPSAVQAAAEAILDRTGLTVEVAVKPSIASAEGIT